MQAMNITRDEAEQALTEIGEARGRVRRLHGYGDAAPFLILWGLIWLVCNSVTEFAPRWADAAWLGGLLIGVPATLAIVVIQARQRGGRHDEAGGLPASMGAKFGMTMGVIMAFLAGTVLIVWPLESREMNAFISLFWACAYMAGGIWVGWRLFWIGAVTAAAIMFGYLALDQYYFAWMAAAGGGSLILGGLWLRKI